GGRRTGGGRFGGAGGRGPLRRAFRLRVGGRRFTVRVTACLVAGGLGLGEFAVLARRLGHLAVGRLGLGQAARIAARRAVERTAELFQPARVDRHRRR